MVGEVVDAAQIIGAYATLYELNGFMMARCEIVRLVYPEAARDHPFSITPEDGREMFLAAFSRNCITIDAALVLFEHASADRLAAIRRAAAIVSAVVTPALAAEVAVFVEQCERWEPQLEQQAVLWHFVRRCIAPPGEAPAAAAASVMH